MYKVRYKSRSATESWHVHGSYGNEVSALSVAAQVRHKYFMVQVLDPAGRVVWSH